MRLAALVTLPGAAACVLGLLATPVHARPPRPRVLPDERSVAEHPTTSPASAQILDNTQRIDANDISMVVTNNGSFAYDMINGTAGFEFPKGSGKTAVFAGGLWLGAQVFGQPRVAVAEYSEEYQPGSMVGGGPDNPDRLEYKVYKLRRHYATTSERDAALADYNSGAVPHGAPAVSVLPDGSLSTLGDQMTWCVFNDADPGRHLAFGTPPLGVEVQQTTFAYDSPGPLGRTVFVRYLIRNQGSNFLQNTYVGLWMDADIGGFVDDLVGCHPNAGLGFMYNAPGADAIYGGQPPAVGVDLLRGPSVSGSPLGLGSYVGYVNGEGPGSALEVYRGLQGLNVFGSAFLDPTTGLPTTFMFPGDPVTGDGWIDGAPADKRMLLGSGPFALAPGQSQEVLYAIIVGQENSSISSLARLACDDVGVQAFADAGFTGPAPVRESCGIPVEQCALSADRWEQMIDGSGDLNPNQKDALASCVGSGSEFLGASPLSVATLQSLIDASNLSTPAGAARREYVAMQLNHCATFLRLPSSSPIVLRPDQPVSCSGLSADRVEQLTAQAAKMVVADYLDRVATNPTPITGVDFGLAAFFGGADAMINLFGTGPNPDTQPELFPNVEIRFDRSHPQLAYRYLRLEQQDGTAPPLGREYRYGGFRSVPFTVWDVTDNVQLDVGFVERAVVDFDGSILPPAFQVATFDSAWSPDDSQFGGREYLFVSLRNYDGQPDANWARDGAPIDFNEPLFVYALTARRTSPGTIIDDGDAFSFARDFGPLTSVDANLIHLARRPPDDPDATLAYQQIAQCLAGVNSSRYQCGGGLLVKAHAGPDVQEECGNVVHLNGSNSEGVGLSFTWSAPGVTFDDPHSPTPSATFPFGTTTVTLEVGAGGEVDRDEVLVTMVDTQAPIVTVTLSPSLLWPPNHVLADVHVTVEVSECDPRAVVTLLSIASNEPDDGLDNEDIPNDIQGASLGTFDQDIQLRAERGDLGSGRVYTVWYEATDASGHVTRSFGTVSAPHDRRGRSTATLGHGVWAITVFGSSTMSARSVDPATVAIEIGTTRLMVPSSVSPSWGDVDGDHREDVVFLLTENLPPLPASGTALYVRWVAGGEGYLADATANVITGVPDAPLPLEFAASVAPNPVQTEAFVTYALPRAGHVRVRVFDVAGREVARLVDEIAPAGRHVARFQPAAPQLYLYTVEWAGMKKSGRFAVLR